MPECSAKEDLGAPFLAFFARSRAFDPLRGRLPFEFLLDFVFLLGMNPARNARPIDGIASSGITARCYVLRITQTPLLGAKISPYGCSGNRSSHGQNGARANW